MVKLASVFLLLATGSLAQAETFSFEDKEPDVILDSTATAVEAAPKSQVAWGKGLNKVGPRCVKDWSSFSPKYAPLATQFDQFAKKASGDVKQIRRDLQGQNYSGMDAPSASEVDAANACSAKAAQVDKRMADTREKVLSALVKLDSLQDELSKLSQEGMGIFRDQAGDNYSRGPFCLFKHYYTDVAEITFGKSPLEHNTGDDSGFAIAQWRLNRAASRLTIEKDRIDVLQAKFKLMRGNCHKQKGDQGYVDIPDDKSGEFTAQ